MMFKCVCCSGSSVCSVTPKIMHSGSLLTLYQAKGNIPAGMKCEVLELLQLFSILCKDFYIL